MELEITEINNFFQMEKNRGETLELREVEINGEYRRLDLRLSRKKADGEKYYMAKGIMLDVNQWRLLVPEIQAAIRNIDAVTTARIKAQMAGTKQAEHSAVNKLKGGK